jgi:hypothetical protein
MNIPYWQLLFCDGKIESFRTEEEARGYQSFWLRRGVLSIIGKVTE